MYNSDSAEKLISVDQWGDIEWTSMYRVFYSANNMDVIAIDVPDLSRVTDMSACHSPTRAFQAQRLAAWCWLCVGCKASCIPVFVPCGGADNGTLEVTKRG